MYLHGCALFQAPDVAEMVVSQGDATGLVRKMNKPKGRLSDASSSSEDEFHKASESLTPAKKKRVVSQSSVEYVNSIDVQLQFEIKEVGT